MSSNFSEWDRPQEAVDAAGAVRDGELDFPELVIVGGHIGYPWPEEMVAVARKHEGV